jgi:hypothetical protein
LNGLALQSSLYRRISKAGGYSDGKKCIGITGGDEREEKLGKRIKVSRVENCRRPPAQRVRDSRN